MSLEVSAEEFERLKSLATDEYGRICDVDLDSNLLKEFEKRGHIEGDSYIPSTMFEGW